jgi:hypothetical protein
LSLGLLGQQAQGTEGLVDFMGHADGQLAGVLQFVQAPPQLAQCGLGGGKVGLGLAEDLSAVMPLDTLTTFQQDSRSHQQGHNKQSA